MEERMSHVRPDPVSPFPVSIATVLDLTLAFPMRPDPTSLDPYLAVQNTQIAGSRRNGGENVKCKA
jgi:hypothetical protein